MKGILEIFVSSGRDGFTFSVAPSVRQQIKKHFRDSYPARSILIGYDTKYDFKSIHDHIEKQIYPALLGLSESEIQKVYSKVIYKNSVNNEVLVEIKLEAT